jgi:hypothetical protein
MESAFFARVSKMHFSRPQQNAFFPTAEKNAIF